MLMGCGRGPDRDRQGGGRAVMHGGGRYRDPRQCGTLTTLRVDIHSTDRGRSFLYLLVDSVVL